MATIRKRGKSWQAQIRLAECPGIKYRTLVDGLMDWVFDRCTRWPRADDFEFNYNNWPT